MPLWILLGHANALLYRERPNGELKEESVFSKANRLSQVQHRGADVTERDDIITQIQNENTDKEPENKRDHERGSLSKRQERAGKRGQNCDRRINRGTTQV